MRGLKAGITGFALMGGALAAPQQALATATFDIESTIAIGLKSLGSGPNNAFAEQVFTSYQADTFIDVGSTSYAESSTDFNNSFPWAPKSGGGAVDLTTLQTIPISPDPLLGAFRVEFAGVANTIPALPSDLFTLAVAPAFGTPGSQVYDFFSEIETELSLSIVPAILVNDVSADPGDTANAGGRYLIDDLSTTGVELTVQVEATPTQDPFATLVDINGNETPLDIDADGVIRLPTGELLSISMVLGPIAETWSFSFEGRGRATTLPGPTSDVPVPAALPLLASAMGGLFWMKRRRKA